VEELDLGDRFTVLGDRVVMFVRDNFLVIFTGLGDTGKGRVASFVMDNFLLTKGS
jgi:hypothetical protein